MGGIPWNFAVAVGNSYFAYIAYPGLSGPVGAGPVSYPPGPTGPFTVVEFP